MASLFPGLVKRCRAYLKGKREARQDARLLRDVQACFARAHEREEREGHVYDDDDDGFVGKSDAEIEELRLEIFAQVGWETGKQSSSQEVK